VQYFSDVADSLRSDAAALTELGQRSITDPRYMLSQRGRAVYASVLPCQVKSPHNLSWAFCTECTRTSSRLHVAHNAGFRST
jgi:hypothetical protein